MLVDRPVSIIAAGRSCELRQAYSAIKTHSTWEEIDMKLMAITITSLAALLSIGQTSAADGKAVFDKACIGCHTVLSPKITGDMANWEPRLKLGNDALVASVIKGKGAMLPRSGNASLTDADIKAAVDYMVTQIK